MGSAPASLADNPFLITLLLEMQTTIFLRTEMSRKTEYVHNPCFLSANILKILGVFAENQKEFLMKLFKHKKNDRKESIKTKAEQATVVLLTKIFQKFGVNNACERLLAWADIHRKAMFGITISFLSFVTILSLVMRPERKPMQVFNEEKSKVQINIDSTLQKKQVGVHDLLEVIKMQNEINELRKNGKLTPEDTIRIKNLYNKLNK